MFLRAPKIAIIGAGPAGLTLARLLHLCDPPIHTTIYESDTSTTSRNSQGGTLDLHIDTGLAAVRACGLWEQFRRYARDDGDEIIIVDKNATEIIRKPASEGESGRPEIDRYRLREILLESVPEENLKWGMKLKEVGDDRTLKFDGIERAEGPFDLVVGADGAWSKVRGKLHGVEPSYSGVSGIEMDIPDPSKTCPHVNKMVGKGGFLGSSDFKFLNAQRMGDKSLKVRTWFLCAEGQTKQMLEKFGKRGTLDKLFEKYKDWAPEMLELLKQADVETMRQWTTYELPVGCKWERKVGFTLLGDAASLSTPFSGQGVNKAMKDALDLASFIQKTQKTSTETLTLDQAVSAYEKSMFPRAEKLQLFTQRNKEYMFRADAPIGLMTNMLSFMAEESGSVFMGWVVASRPVLGVAYGYFWGRKQVGWAVRRFWRGT